MVFQGFGSDLRLLHDLTHQDDRHRGSDLSTARRPQTGLIDLAVVSSVDNLEQALLLRFLTHTGELAVLGHPDYGCLLFTLIGELNNDSNRDLAKLYTLEALQAEPRVKEVASVDVTQDPNYPDTVNIQVSIIPIDSSTPLDLVFGFSFTGGINL